MKRMIVAVALLVLISGPVRADFADGAQAYDGGDYAAAFRSWMELAVSGDVRAQTAIAGMYRFGEGRRVDLGASAGWYRRAAAAGEPVAQMNLGEMYMQGLGVRRDPVEAYKWLSLAAAQGRVWAQRRRAWLVRTMSPTELAAARRALKQPGPAGPQR
jgi:uncharacterized protein